MPSAVSLSALLIHFPLIILQVENLYRYAPYNDVSVNNGPHIRRWSRKIIMLWYLPMCYNCLQCSVQ